MLMKRMLRSVRKVWNVFFAVVSLLVVLPAHFFLRTCDRFSHSRLVPGFLARPLAAISLSLYARFASHRSGGSVSRLDLIDLSLRNMKARKTRTRITVGGMTVGIGMIVFLVSIGFGLQRLVIERVARLEEMSQFDVLPPSGGKLRIDDASIADLTAISEIVSVSPMISVVGRVDHNGSVSDMAAYGVTTEYLRQSAIRPSVGALFENDSIVPTSFVSGQDEDGTPSGSSPSFGMKIGDVAFSGTSSWVRVRESPDVDAPLIGYSRISGIAGYGDE